jgi:hypothetical protein
MATTFDLIQSQTIASNASTVTFNSLGSYTDLQLETTFSVPYTSGTSYDVLMRMNGDTGSNYYILQANNTDTNTFDNTFQYGVSSVVVAGGYNSPSDATFPVTFSITFPEYGSTSYTKNGAWNFAYVANPGANRSNAGFGVYQWRNTGAITSISLISTNGNFKGTFNLYGITAGNA